jgi:hypothetical protein
MEWSSAATPLALRRIAHGSGIFVAVDKDGNGAYSRDGFNWQTTGSVATYGEVQLTYGAGMFLLVSGKSQYFTSVDGLSWVERGRFSYPWRRAEHAFGTTDKLFVTAFGERDPTTYVSSDGLAWDEIGSPGFDYYPDRAAIAFGNGTYCMAGEVRSLRSTNAMNWLPTEPLFTVVFVKDRFVGIGPDGAQLSKDCASWHPGAATPLPTASGKLNRFISSTAFKGRVIAVSPSAIATAHVEE